MPRNIVLYRPGRGFRTVSVTGRRCDLQCDHCRGRFLESMFDVSDVGGLVRFGERAVREGIRGFLISGGCAPDGSVPLLERLGEMKELKRMGLELNIHTGLLDEGAAIALASVGADAYSLDMHASPDVIRNVLHLNAVPEDYARTLRLFCASAPGKVSPHICAGLEGDTIEHELKAVDACSKEDIRSLILLRHIRAKGTALDPHPALGDARFLELVRYAAERTDADVILGCMRPRPSADLEVRCVQAGACGIASPSPSTKGRLEALGFEVSESDACCAVHL